MTVPLSVLDLSPISEGSDARQALRNTIDLAQQAEAWGYKRFWVAEHHFVSVASSSPAVLIGLVAAATRTIRVGSAAVQTGFYPASSIVEAFGTIDALHPGRIDLGLGRSGQRRIEILAGKRDSEQTQKRSTEVRGGVVIPAAFSPAQLLNSDRVAATYATVQQPGAQSPDFADQVDDIRALLGGSYATPDGVPLVATPGAGADVELWIFGSSAGQSAQVAGRLGLPFVANYHVSPGTILDTVEAYRVAFRPSAGLAKPHLVVSADVVVAESDPAAQRIATGYGRWVHSIRSGRGAIPYPDPETVEALTDSERELVEDRLLTQFVGAPATVADGLQSLRELTNADELVITSVAHSHADRLDSHRLLAQVWGLTSRVA